MFATLKFTWKLGARQNKAETLKIIYCRCAIEPSFASEANWQSGNYMLREEARVKGSLSP